MILQTTLSLAAAAIVINLWQFVRIVRLRVTAKVIHGDGGNALLMQRMRAHSNFIEHAPLFLILVAAIELTGKGGTRLAIAGSLFMLARVAHALGMDRSGANLLRGIGMVVTITAEIALAVAALLIALGRV